MVKQELNVSCESNNNWLTQEHRMNAKVNGSSESISVNVRGKGSM